MITAKLSVQFFSVITAAILAQTPASAQTIDTAADGAVEARAASQLSTALAEPGRRRPRSDRSSARLHHARALELETDGKTMEAIAEERQAIAFDPNDPAQQIHMGSLLIDDGQLANALITYEQVCLRFPSQSKYLQEIIDSLRSGLQVGTIEEALQEFPNQTTSQRQTALEEIRRGIAADPTSIVVSPKGQKGSSAMPPRRRRVADRSRGLSDDELYRLPGTEFNMWYVP